MARIQALKQQRFLETSDAPITSTQVTGGFSGVSKMHQLKSSNPVFKATGLLKKVKIKKPRLPSLSIRMPKL